MDINSLKKQYNDACNQYVDVFCKKQNLQFDGWVNDIVGEIVLCGDFFFNLSDIVFDVNSKQRKGAILNWYYDNLENKENSINYYSYTKGLRVKDIK